MGYLVINKNKKFRFSNFLASSVPLLHGLLSDSMFSYEPRTLENGLFPANINVHVEFLGYQHNFSLYQIQGLAKTSSLNSKVLIINNSNSEINEANSENQNLVCLP